MFPFQFNFNALQKGIKTFVLCSLSRYVVCFEGFTNAIGMCYCLKTHCLVILTSVQIPITY